MSKPLLQLAAVGVLGVALWKLVLPFFFGFLATLLKVALLVAVAFFAVWLFKRMSDKKDGEQPAE